MNEILLATGKERSTVDGRRRPRIYWLITAFILVSLRGAFAQPCSGRLQTVPYPIQEAYQRLCRNLAQEGYQIQGRASGNQSLLVTASKHGRIHSIFLRPKSPLATEICFPEGMLAVPLSPPTPMTSSKRTRSRLRPILGNAAGEDRSIPQPVLEQLSAAVCLEAVVGDKRIQFSGVSINGKGWILSTAHDLGNSRKVRILLADGDERTGTVVRKDPGSDLMLIVADRASDGWVSMKRRRRLLAVGEAVYSISCPFGLQGTIHQGVINGPPRRTNGQALWQVDMEVFPGSSGGPVFDEDGRFVGLIKGRFRGTTTIGFVIPMETIEVFLTGGT